MNRKLMGHTMGLATALICHGCEMSAQEAEGYSDDTHTLSESDRDYSATKTDRARNGNLPAYQTELLGRSVFIVEDDMVFESAESVQNYFGRLQNDGDKSIVNLRSSGARDVRADQIASTAVKEFRYCFAAGSWGSTVDLNGDGVADDFNGDGVADVMPTIAQVRPGLQAGMRAWEGVANVRFVYDPVNDGANCASHPASFRITLNPNSASTATGPFPSLANQALTIPRAGLGDLLAIHEVGHALGFRHEHIHSAASPQCSEGDTNFEQLFTSYDAQSAMVYANCTVSSVIGGFRVSRLDGMGARVLYGNPQWWSGVVL